MNSANNAKTYQKLTQAECLYDLTAIDEALNKVASQLNAIYQDKQPIVLCVMNGALLTMGHLLPKLTFALEVDYIHASRYGDKVFGGALHWKHQPETDLKGRHVILVEDIVDQGDTLKALKEFCHEQQAQTIRCAALLSKTDVIQASESADFVGLTIPDRYVVGFGLDYQGIGRNLPGIFAL